MSFSCAYRLHWVQLFKAVDRSIASKTTIPLNILNVVFEARSSVDMVEVVILFPSLPVYITYHYQITDKFFLKRHVLYNRICDILSRMVNLLSSDLT